MFKIRYIHMENSDSKNIDVYASLTASEKNQKFLDAVFARKLKEFKLLLEAGANVNALNLTNDTALKVSAEKGHIEMVNILIQAGADLTVVNQSGQTALSSAVKKNFIRIIVLLFSAMTQDQVANELLLESVTKVSSMFPTRTLPRYLEKFKQIVIDHRISIFKKLGPLFLDKSKDNVFSFLPPELKEIILLHYCTHLNKEAWQDFHGELDEKVIFQAINKNKLLTFSPKLQPENKKTISEEGDLSSRIHQLKISQKKENSPKSSRKPCLHS